MRISHPKTFSDCCQGMSKVLHQKQYGRAEGDGETMRSLCGMLVSGGVRTGCVGKGGES